MTSNNLRPDEIAALRTVKHQRTCGWTIAVGVTGGFTTMAALIEFVCVGEHGTRNDPRVTFEQRAWAYCAAGATDGHSWTRIDPTALEIVRSRPGFGRPHLVPDKSDEGSLAGGPLR